MAVRASSNHWFAVFAPAKVLTFTVLLVPCLWLTYAALSDMLGPNPAEALVRSLGDWTLRSLCLVLAITPLRVTLSWPLLARYRRMVGLYVFFYALLHMLAYAWFDRGFEWGEIGIDIAKRPFILVGFIAFVLLSLLAITSWKRAVRALGGRNWQLLHRSVYVIAALSILHFFWMRAGKNNYAEVWVYAAILLLLLAWRLWRRYRSSLGRW